MKEYSLCTLILLAALSSLIFSCARQSAPTGGPKDTTPPVITRSAPLNGSINYKGKNIVITFDEYIVLDKINEKFMISPPMSKKPDIFLRGKNLFIEFQEELKDSSTYTLYFQDAIRDLNEGNPIPNFQFVFSTGKTIDSLSVTGNVLNSLNLEASENVLVMMYKQTADSAPEKSIPDFITLADANGGFRLNNVSEGVYRLYALQDANNNKKYDLRDERFAFTDSLVVITAAKNYLQITKDTSVSKTKQKKVADVQVIDGEYKLFSFKSALKNHYLTSSSRKLPYQLVYTLSLPPDTSRFEFETEDSDEKNYFIEKSLAGDTINVWLTDSTLYSKSQINTIISYLFTDTTGAVTYKKDTIPMRYISNRVTRAREAQTRYKFTTNLGDNFLKPGHQIIILSQTPFRDPDTFRIKLYEMHSTDSTLIPYFFVKDSLNSCRYYLMTKLKEGGTYFFVADSGAFENIYGEHADSTGIKFSVRKTDSYGRLTFIIKNGEGDLVIQLLDTKENVVAERFLSNEGKAEFPLLDKGIYRARVIYDLNGDKKWTTGNFDFKQQPEPASYFPDEIEIKINWESQEDWDVSKRNQKEQKLKLKKDQNR